MPASETIPEDVRQRIMELMDSTLGYDAFVDAICATILSERTRATAAAAAKIERLEADLAAKHHQFLYEAENHSEWLEKFMAMKARAEAAEALCDKLAEALRPFAEAADLVDLAPEEMPAGSWVTSDSDTRLIPRVKHFRRAREALEQVGKR